MFLIYDIAVEQEGFKMAKSKLIKVNQKIEEAVVGGYKAVEESVVGGFQKISDHFVDQYLTKDGETLEEAQARLKSEDEMRKQERNKQLEKHYESK